jgi:hypothetical protein
MIALISILILLIAVSPLFQIKERRAIAWVASIGCGGHWVLFYAMSNHTNIQPKYLLFLSAILACTWVIEKISKVEVHTNYSITLMVMPLVIIFNNIYGSILYYFGGNMISYLLLNIAAYAVIIRTLYSDGDTNGILLRGASRLLYKLGFRSGSAYRNAGNRGDTRITGHMVNKRCH